jgi:hypothetical protein
LKRRGTEGNKVGFKIPRSSVIFWTFPEKNPIFMPVVIDIPTRHYSKEWAAGRYEI